LFGGKIYGASGVLAMNKPTDPWESPNKKTVQKLFAIGRKASEDDFDRKSRYIKYVLWGISALLFMGFLSFLF
jgi:hypothetical protein